MQARIKTKNDTTANWNAASGFVPLKGEIIIYTDYETENVEENGQTVVKTIPNMKIGDGSAYVQDLPFVSQNLRDQLNAHIQNGDVHTTPIEKVFWNNKVNIDDSEEINAELVGETLIFTRD